MTVNDVSRLPEKILGDCLPPKVKHGQSGQLLLV